MAASTGDGITAGGGAEARVGEGSVAMKWMAAACKVVAADGAVGVGRAAKRQVVR